MSPHVISLALLLLSSIPGNRGGKRGGELTVTAVVTSSVSITVAADGTQTVIVANAPADGTALVDAATQARPTLLHEKQRKVVQKRRRKLLVNRK